MFRSVSAQLLSKLSNTFNPIIPRSSSLSVKPRDIHRVQELSSPRLKISPASPASVEESKLLPTLGSKGASPLSPTPKSTSTPSSSPSPQPLSKQAVVVASSSKPLIPSSPSIQQEVISYGSANNDAVTDSIEINTSEFKTPEQLEEEAIKAHPNLYRSYLFHGAGSIIGELAYTAFTYFLAVISFNLIFSALLDTPQDEVADEMGDWYLLMQYLLGLGAAISYIANAIMISPIRDAKDAVVAYNKDPSTGLLNTLWNNKLNSLCMLIHFLAGADANVDQLNNKVGSYKPLVYPPAIYFAFSFYVLFNARDVIKASKASDSPEYKSDSMRFKEAKGVEEKLSVLTVTLNKKITVMYRDGTFAYFGYDFALQNGMQGKANIGAYCSAGIVGLATHPIAKYTREPAIDARYYVDGVDEAKLEEARQEARKKPENTEAADKVKFLSQKKENHTKFQAALQKYAQSPLSQKAYDFAKQMISFSPGTFLSLTPVFSTFTSIANTAQPLLGNAGAKVVAGTSSLLLYTFLQAVHRPSEIRKATITLLAENEKKTNGESVIQPNGLAKAFGAISTSVDQGCRAAATVPMFFTLMGFDVTQKGFKPEAQLVYLFLLVGAYVASGNIPYMAKKAIDNFARTYPKWFAQKPDPTAYQALASEHDIESGQVHEPS